LFFVPVYQSPFFLLLHCQTPAFTSFCPSLEKQSCDFLFFYTEG
jgi:hypothetical protein